MRLSLPCILCLPWFSLHALDFPSTPPVEPQDAAKSFHVLDGFEMQLIAAEPLVTDPVAITYDADGRAYVCEMNDYPYTDKEHHKASQENPTDQPIGKVRLLTDTDGDGIFDKATVFADGLSWPTGAACWKGGIFVTATPDVWYLKDTNDDGVADVRQKVFTGFKKLNVQAVMNNPIWGLDHRIYVAGGSNGGEIQRCRSGLWPDDSPAGILPAEGKPITLGRHDFSFDPSTGDVRLESGGARFGNTFDDWGNRFLCNIRNPCQHVVLPYRYLARNPYLVVPSALNDCAEAGDQLPVWRTSPPEPWREFRAKRWVQEGSHLPKSELVGAGVVTSSAGICVYRGDAYPKEYRDFAFVADVAGNLFYRMKLVPDGVTFKAVQVDGKKNFCTSDDLWFRPVNFVNAPDGCLHVCDMYREVIEHPWSIPDDIHAAVDLLRGRDKGRIWRLAPKAWGTGVPPVQNKQARRLSPMLSRASTTDLVALLDHPNAWHRETAQRLLFERQDKAAVEPLRELVKSGKTAQGRIGALWSLHGLGHGNTQIATVPEPTPEVAKSSDVQTWPWQGSHLGSLLETQINNAIRDDPSSHVRAAGFQLKAEFLEKRPTFWKRFADDILVTNSDQQHAGTSAPLWAAFALGEGGPVSYYPERLTYLMLKHGKDPWLAHAIEASAFRLGPAQSLMAFSIPADMADPSSWNSLIRHLATAAVDSKEFEQLITFFSNEAAKLDKENPEALVTAASLEDVLIGFAQGLSRKGKSFTEIKWPAAATEWLNQRINKAKSHLQDPARSPDERLKCLPLLVLDSPDSARPILTQLLQPSQPPELQLAALEALGSYREPAVADLLIDAWPKMTPALRDKATTILLSRTDRIARLLDAIEAKKITLTQLSVAAKATLGRQKTPALAKRIAKLIGDGSSSNRKEVIEKYLVAMGIKERRLPAVDDGKMPSLPTGDATRGAKIYETVCMVCHKFADKGNDVGPHLGTIKAWTAEQLVTNILDPNREVSPNFALYLVETNDGRTLSGLITSETAGNLTLKRADGGTDTVLRSEIKSLTSPGISLMPEGLEAAITPQQMADLIAFLKQ